MLFFHSDVIGVHLNRNSLSLVHKRMIGVMILLVVLNLWCFLEQVFLYGFWLQSPYAGKSVPYSFVNLRFNARAL